MDIWQFTIAGTTIHNEYDLDCTCGKVNRKRVLLTSLKKCRSAVKIEMARENSSISSSDNWTQENWRNNKTECTVMNSGGSPIFGFRKLEVF